MGAFFKRVNSKGNAAAAKCVKGLRFCVTKRQIASNDASTLVSVDEGAAAAFLPPIKLSLDDLVEKSVKKPNS